MNVTLLPSVPSGIIRAIPSKSAAHRALICAAFANSDTKIRCDGTNKDIEATVECLCALGANIVYERPFFKVSPIKELPQSVTLRCGESGSTLRFLLPIIPALGIEASFVLEGRLPERPLSPLYEELIAHGAQLSPQGSNPLVCRGSLTGNEYKIRGDVSSQFISGLLFALTLSGEGGKLTIEGKVESEPYIDMTVKALRKFGAEPQKTEYGYSVSKKAKICAPSGELDVEGDWSGAAFPLCMGAIGKGRVTVTGLDLNSHQGDKAVVDVLRRFGADICECDGSITVCGGRSLCGIEINASNIPDLVPVLATVASVAEGVTVIKGAARLRLKESDRLATVKNMLCSLGANVKETENGLIIKGKKMLVGGTANGANDHRIAMSAAVASVVCASPVTVTGAECVAKSYPDFWNDIGSQLNVKIN